MKSKRLVLTAVVVLLAAAICVCFRFTSRHKLVANALDIRFVGAEAGRIAITNRTSNPLVVQFLAVQTKGRNDWMDLPLMIAPEAIPPHETVSKRINPAPSGVPWRLKMLVAEEITGGDRMVQASVAYVRECWDGVCGPRMLPRPNAFAPSRRYCGSETVIVSPVFE